MSKAPVKIEVSEGIAQITLNRPDALNAFDMAMREALSALVPRLYEDDAIRVVLLTGAGRAFCAGGDIKEFDEKLSTTHYRYQLRRITRFFDDLEALEKPVIAALNGPATGAGIGLALACDLRIGSPEAKLGFREQFIGLISAAGGFSRLTRLVGLGKAKEIVFTGEMLDGEQAREIGLVNRVYPAKSLLAESKALARQLCERAPQALGLAKRVLNSATNIDQQSSLFLESLAQSLLTQTDDHREGVQAFLEKRRARFNR